MEAQTIVFRTDASLQIGTGHVMRCLTLAEALRQRGHTCHFISRNHPGNLSETIRQRGFAIHELPQSTARDGEKLSDLAPAHALWLGESWETDAHQSEVVIRELNPDWLVVDHYALDARWEVATRPPGAHVMVIDDLADRTHDADLLLDQNLGHHSSDYKGLVPNQCQLLIGPQYAMLRPEFAALRFESLQRRHFPRLKRILITMGGVDRDNATGKVLDALRKCPLPRAIELDVVMGSQSPHLDSVRKQATTMPWTTQVQVDISDMAKHMVEADLAIGAAGSTSWERCCLGLPTLLVVLADNQFSTAKALQNVNASILLGTPKDVMNIPKYWPALVDEAALKKISESSSVLTDGNGVLKVVQKLETSSY